MKQPARTIDPKTLEPKLHLSSNSATFKTMDEKRDEYLENHKKYKENKLE